MADQNDDPISIDWDRDSSLGDDDAASETTSLRSSVFQHVYENGRRYNGYRSGAYWGPNDEEAQDNLDLFHHIFTLTFGGHLHLAPLKDPQRVLDIGTGTGIWAIEFGDANPSASVVATDLSPIQPDLVPPNVEFQIDDFTAEWTFQRDSFDYIHARSLYGCVADYQALYAEVLTALKPGAWFEQAEISVLPTSDDGSTKGTYLEQWGSYALENGKKFGKSFSIAEDSPAEFHKAGFESVTYKQYKWPIGSWPKDPQLKRIGLFNRMAIEDGIEGWAMFLFTNVAGWSVQEVQILIAGIKRELRDPKIHAWQYMTVCYGQKPG